ncbi:MAG: hypothetical protein U1E51_34435 [Candidatus Binatia bacterium]|nr:hypothetical protein [Candidatus Binatia bacterium]
MTTAVTGRQSDRAILARTKLGGVVLADQVKNIDWPVRKADLICKPPREATSFGTCNIPIRVNLPAMESAPLIEL